MRKAAGRDGGSPRGADVVLLRLAATAFGLALAISLSGWFVRAAPEGQTAGFMTQHGLDARGPLQIVVVLILLPLITSIASAPLIRRLCEADVPRWPRIATAAAWFLSLWSAVAEPRLLVVLIPTAVATLLIFFFRRIDAQFSRADVVLIPTFLTLFVLAAPLARPLGFVAVACTAAVVLLAIRLGVAATGTHDPAASFFLSPLGLLFGVLAPRGVIANAAGIAFTLVVPFILRVVRGARRRALLAFVVYPLFAFTYSWVQRPIFIEGRPRVNFFEDGHSLLPASEMLRGERPYKDVTPGHGLISDGLLDYVFARIAGDDIGTILRNREIVETFLAVAIYFLGFAATGSAEAGLFGYLLSISVLAFWTPVEPPLPVLWWTPAIRSLPAIASLAFLAASARARSTRYLLPAAAFAAFAIWVSVDFAAYILLVLIVAVVRLRGRRAMRNVVAGLLIGFVPLAAGLLLAGVLDDFFKVTLTEVLTLGAVYSIGFFEFPARFDFYRGVPEALALLFVPSAIWIVVWIVVALYTLASLGRSLARAERRTEPLILIGLLIVVEAIAYGERLNIHYMPLAVVFFAVAAWTAARSRRPAVRTWSVIAVVVLLVIAGPTRHLARTFSHLTSGPADSRLFTAYDPLRRSQGGLFRRDRAAGLRLTQKYVESRLAPNETFLDFASLPILYFLLEKPCPIRQYEVPFIQDPRLQQEVIRRVQQDRSIQAVLMNFPELTLPIDNVPSSVRAPLVYRYLQQEFEPDFNEGGVVFWRRRGS